jgi:putative membrane protein
MRAAAHQSALDHLRDRTAPAGYARITGVLTVLRTWFDPSESQPAGAGGDADPTGPDYRFSLANERTFLAWLRTGLALIGGGLAVAQFLTAGWVRDALAVALLGLGGLVALRAVDHWARCERAIRRGNELPPSRFPAVLALLIAFGAGALVAVVLLGAVGR